MIRADLRPCQRTRARTHSRLSLEALEDRCLLTAPAFTLPAQFGTEAALDQYLVNGALTSYQNLFGQTFQNGGYPVVYVGGCAYLQQQIATPTSLTAATTLYAADAANPNSFSTTNVQVQGVDEADIVKTDGNYIYDISGQELIILKAWPAQDLSIVARLPIEGYFNALYLNGNRLTVITSVYNGQTAVEPLVRTPDGFPLVYPNTTMTKLTVLDVTDPTNPQVVQAVYMDGSYVNSRSIGNDVYLVVQNYFAGLPAPAYTNFNGTTIYESQASYLNRISGHESDLALPHLYVRPGGPGTPLQPAGFVTDPASIYQPEVSSDYDLLTLLTFDTTSNTTGPTSTTSLFTSYAYNVYASLTHLYVTTPYYPASGSGIDSGTRIDQFTLSGNQASLTAVGWTPGQVYQQFWLDEQGSYLRVVTTSGWGVTAVDSVYVLDDTSSSLPIVGKLENFAVGETIGSVRFLDTRLFVTTSKQVDPLYTIDLSQPTTPQGVVELHLPGTLWFSYLQPLDSNHLLGVGRTTDAYPGEPLQITLFDITDLSHPVALDQHVIEPANWTWWWGSGSEAEWDHHALSYFPESQELAIPIYGYYTGIQFTGYVSSLYVWKVDLNRGFQLLGHIDHDSQVRRSLRINDQLYSLADDSVQVHPLASPNDPGTEVRIHDDPRFPVSFPIAAVEGTPFSQTLLSFKVTDPTGLSATINWGDGQTSSGIIAPDTEPSRYTVAGSHTYTQAGYFTISVAFTRNGQTLDTLYNYFSIVIVDQVKQAYITQLYQDVLNREVDSIGLADWGQEMNQGVPRAAVAAGVQSSQEAERQTIDGFYMKLLGRHAEAAGLGAWLNYLGQGHTTDEVEAGILGSREYALANGGNDTSFLQAVYADVLGRTIDAVGAAAWGQALRQGQTHAAVALEILHSQEALQDSVEQLYQRYLHRQADAAGLQFFVAELQHGVSQQAVAAAILGSNEYLHRP